MRGEDKRELSTKRGITVEEHGLAAMRYGIIQERFHQYKMIGLSALEPGALGELLSILLGAAGLGVDCREPTEIDWIVSSDAETSMRSADATTSGAAFGWLGDVDTSLWRVALVGRSDDWGKYREVTHSNFFGQSTKRVPPCEHCGHIRCVQ